MFDGFKIQLVNSNHVLEYDGFDKTTTYCNDYGVIHKTVYQVSSFSFHHYSDNDTIYVNGSFHKYYNNSIHNFNRFTFQNFLSTTSEFLKLFSLRAENCILKNVEYGVNISLSYDVNSVLNCLLLHKSVMPLKPRKTDFRFKHQRYELKIYNKSSQYEYLTDDTNILRFEIRYERMIKLNDKGLYALSDLLSANSLTFFNNELIAEWKSILMYDFTIDTKSLNTKDVILLKDFRNPNFWSDLKSNRRYRPKQRLKNIINKYSDNIQGIIANQIKNNIEVNCVIIND